MRVTEIIQKLSTARMEFQTSSGSVLNSFVVPFFIDRLDLRKVSHTVALAGSRGSGKSTYIQYFSHSTRFDKSLTSINEEEFDCILLYWKPDIAYCQGLKTGWLGDSALHFFSLHASLSLLNELSKLITNVNNHFPDLIPSLHDNGKFWNAVTKVTGQNICEIEDLNNWIMEYQYEISTRLNPLNTKGMLSIQPKQMLQFLTDCLRSDYKRFELSTFKVFIDEFELLNIEQQKLINTYRKESNLSLNWNVAYKLNSKPTIKTTSNQWLQSPDDYVEENLDGYIESDYTIFAAEIFILTLQNAGLLCRTANLTPTFLGTRKNINYRQKQAYQSDVLSIIRMLLPTPQIAMLSEMCISTKTIQTKLRNTLKDLKISTEAKKKILENNSLAITLLGTYKQRSFSSELFEKYVLEKSSLAENSKIKEKISTYEFNTLLSLNLQHSSLEIPVYAGFERFITMTRPNIRHFKELCLSALKQSNANESDGEYSYIEDIIPLSFKSMHIGSIAKSTALVNEVISYPPHGRKLSQMVNRIGELFRISQKSSYQTEPERVIFTFPYDHAGADEELEAFLASALSWRVLVEDDSKRIKDDNQITNKEFQLNPVYAPKFGISFRKKRGISFRLNEFKTIVAGTSEEFERIRKSYQQKWKADDSEDRQGILEI
ncbi:hypothetical protein [Methylophaga nitratireducenticrescens]|uniref:ORC-CDC6 family AAA ATPase n=1 Tax=Methylophaga nitratireducenticrescens TaxID=754476 RepID=UPI000CDBF3F0|nr:hypothetical protein [Methylophaga nitratireducenticrescens]AUZ83796.1 hypothetical protein CDW43_04065 [Methylophaga nitratireducenticrescens]